MAKMIVTLKVMPSSIDVDLNELAERIRKKITPLGAEVGKVDFKPVAFGLKAIEIVFVCDESKSVEEIEDAIKEFDDVSSASVTDMRRALG